MPSMAPRAASSTSRRAPQVLAQGGSGPDPAQPPPGSLLPPGILQALPHLSPGAQAQLVALVLSDAIGGPTWSAPQAARYFAEDLAELLAQHCPEAAVAALVAGAAEVLRTQRPPAGSPESPRIPATAAVGDSSQADLESILRGLRDSPLCRALVRLGALVDRLGLTADGDVAEPLLLGKLTADPASGKRSCPPWSTGVRPSCSRSNTCPIDSRRDFDGRPQ